MFENLPVISRADLNVWRDESLPYFGTVVERCVKETGVGLEAIYCMCRQLSEHNLELVAVLTSNVRAFIEGMEERFGAVDWSLCFAYVSAELALLRLIDRALEVKDVKVKY